MGRAYFSEDFPIDSKACKKNLLRHKELKDWLPQLADRLEGLQSWTLESTEQVVRAFAEELDVKAGIIINAIRTVITGQLAGPGIFDVLKAIGKDRVVKRLRGVPELFKGP